MNRKTGPELSVVAGGYEECDVDYVVDRAGFDFPTLEFVMGGSGALVINQTRHELLPGTVFTYGRDTCHRIETDPEHPLVKYFVVLRGGHLAAALRRAGLTPGSVMHTTQPDRIRQIYDDLIDFGLGDRTDRATCCMEAAKYLMLMITELRMPTSVSALRAFSTYERSRQYIEAHGLELRRVSEVAAACHVDQAYLCRLFQRFGRERPFHYLQHIRMNHAMTQLQTSRRLIKEIAAELGYGDTANFTRSFRRWFGIAPQTVRQ